MYVHHARTYFAADTNLAAVFGDFATSRIALTSYAILCLVQIGLT